MKLTYEGLQDRTAWETRNIELPSYDVGQMAQNGREHPRWVHFGIGNIFRIFLGSIADRLMEEGLLDSGITCVETFDFETVSRIYKPYDNLALAVYLNKDGSRRKKVFGCFAEAIEGKSSDPSEWERLKEVFRAPSLQMVSFTITEKGYALRDRRGEYTDLIRRDLEEGPAHVSHAMSIVAALLLERFKSGQTPIALVSMDNCSHNGEILRNAVLEIADAWKERGFVDESFLSYVRNEDKTAFPWTMIDKITPRPGEDVAESLKADGVEDMDIVVTQKRTYIAPFVNAEEPQYLVVEDSFPNGRPPLEKAGVYMTDRDTVNKAERMKVTVCLNPVHAALAPYGILLGYTFFADTMSDPQLRKLAEKVGLQEGMEFVEDPGIISPENFIRECLEERFPNRCLGDTCARIVTDASQGLPIRFGENIKACVRKYQTAQKLTGIALALAGWLRYVLGTDDEGNEYELSPDPYAPLIHEDLKQIRIGDPDSAKGLLTPILGNENIYGLDLYKAGIGDETERIFLKLIAGKGAVRRTLQELL